MVERQLPKLNVAGSSPVIRSIFLSNSVFIRFNPFSQKILSFLL